LLQTVGLVPSNTFDASRYVAATSGRVNATVQGCNQNLDADEGTQFAQRALCFSPTQGGAVTSGSLDSAPLVSNINGFTTVASWNGSSVRIRDSDGACDVYERVCACVSARGERLCVAVC
jgi:hypothetical protein